MPSNYRFILTMWFSKDPDDPDLSELPLGEDGAVSPLPPRQREAWPGRQQGRGQAGVWQREGEGAVERPRPLIGRQIQPQLLIGGQRRHAHTHRGHHPPRLWRLWRGFKVK